MQCKDKEEDYKLAKIHTLNSAICIVKQSEKKLLDQRIPLSRSTPKLNGVHPGPMLNPIFREICYPPPDNPINNADFKYLFSYEKNSTRHL